MKLNKNDVVKTIQEVAEKYDFKFLQKEVDTLIKIFNDTYVELGEKLEVGENVLVGVVKVSKKETKEQSGVSKLHGTETEWTVPAKEKIVLGAKTSFIKENEKEI